MRPSMSGFAFVDATEGAIVRVAEADVTAPEGLDTTTRYTLSSLAVVAVTLSLDDGLPTSEKGPPSPETCH
jgi:hypothetical protein